MYVCMYLCTYTYNFKHSNKFDMNVKHRYTCILYFMLSCYCLYFHTHTHTPKIGDIHKFVSLTIKKYKR